MIQTITDFKHPHFIGIAGTGMSAIAQYLQGIGMQVTGSDRYFDQGTALDIQHKIQATGILCYPQDGTGITPLTDVVICSTAIEDTVPEVVQAKALNIPVIHRSTALTLIANSKKTIAIGGTSGKSTTCAMLYTILEQAGMQPSIISGAGLVQLIQQGLIGNAYVGKGDWLIIEADESDGSIVQYKPAVGVLLNMDKDHKEMEVLLELFTKFRQHSSHFIVNQSHPLASQLSTNTAHDYSITQAQAGTVASNYSTHAFTIQYSIQDVPFTIPSIGRHTMENACAATAVAVYCGATLTQCSQALATYQGIYRRHQIIGCKHGVWLIDDYAHNPVKCAASIAACQPLSTHIIAWFQPHGYGPTKFLKDEFVHEISAVLRPTDAVWMSEIYYAGGTATKDISANDLIIGIQANGKAATFIPNRKDLVAHLKAYMATLALPTHATVVLLLMGARDPSLESFAQEVWAGL